jgi:hypothetical protein
MAATRPFSDLGTLDQASIQTQAQSTGSSTK